jgi:hypothetical protein
MKIDRRVSRIIGRFAELLLPFETLLACPRLQQGPVDSEMLGGQQMVSPGLREDSRRRASSVIARIVRSG